MPCIAQTRTASTTFYAVCGKITASGGSLAYHVVVLPCCWRTASDVTRRLPNVAASELSVVATAFASGRARPRADVLAANAMIRSLFHSDVSRASPQAKGRRNTALRGG